MRAHLVYSGQNILGEGPQWSVNQNRLFWTDITAREIYAYSPEDRRFDKWKMPEKIGSFAFRTDSELVVALATGFCLFDLKTSAISRLNSPPIGGANIFNDGKCDRKGRFWSGTSDVEERRYTGSLYCLDTDYTWRQMDAGIGISNGICWSPDNSRMYFADSLAANIYVYDFDIESGAISNRTIFLNTRELGGVPDGATVDSDGCVWSAIWGGSKVVRIRPNGEIDEVITLPVGNPTSCTFGGRDLDVLYVTSACEGLDEHALSKQPLAGSLFSIDAGVKGLPEPHFQG